jgi:hypothetical protein
MPSEVLYPLRGPVIFNHENRKRFIRQHYSELVEHLGRMPSIPESWLIRRMCVTAWELFWLDRRIEEEESERQKLALIKTKQTSEIRLRADLAALGLMPGRRARQMTGEKKRAAAEGWQDAIGAVQED